MKISPSDAAAKKDLESCMKKFMEQRKKQIEEEKKEQIDEENEYDSDYDEEGRYIWGIEGEDWEFYYQEDKEAYERGESTVPETLNPGALPQEDKIRIEATTHAGMGDQIIGASLARDGAVYRTRRLAVGQANDQI